MFYEVVKELLNLPFDFKADLPDEICNYEVLNHKTDMLKNFHCSMFESF
jgi:hypothetical protein